MTERERQIHYLRARVARLDEILNRAEVSEFQRLVTILTVERDAWATLLRQTEDCSPSHPDMGALKAADIVIATPPLLFENEIDAIVNPSPTTRIYAFLLRLGDILASWFCFIPGTPPDEELFFCIIETELRKVDEQFSEGGDNLSPQARDRATLQAKILVCEMGMEAGHYGRCPEVLRYAWREKLRYESELTLLDSGQ